MKTSGIYAIRRGERSYIGSAVNISNRWCRHRSELRKGLHPNPHLQSAWTLYGEDAFEFVVLEECPIDCLIEREQYHLDLHSDKYNIAPVAGSWLGLSHSSETKAKISASRTGQTVSPEARAKMSASRIGNKNAVGTVHTPETRAKWSAQRMGHEVSSETRKKLAAVNKGRQHTPEARANMSAAQQGSRHTLESRAKMSAAQTARRERERIERGTR